MSVTLRCLVFCPTKNTDSCISVKVEFSEKEGQISLAEIQRQAEDSKPKAYNKEKRKFSLRF